MSPPLVYLNHAKKGLAPTFGESVAAVEAEVRSRVYETLYVWAERGRGQEWVELAVELARLAHRCGTEVVLLVALGRGTLEKLDNGDIQSSYDITLVSRPKVNRYPVRCIWCS